MKISPRTKKYCKVLFAKMGCIYPNLWEKQFKNCSDLQAQQIYDLWEGMIEKLSDEALKRGMEELWRNSKVFTSYPPNAKEFYELCQPFNRKPYQPKKISKSSQKKDPDFFKKLIKIIHEKGKI